MMHEPRVRFKRDDGSSYPAWKQGRFGDLIEVYDVKVTSDCALPVLTSSKTDGIQYQSDHFGREQLHDITGYNVIPRGYCTYRNRSDGTDFTFNINNLCDRGIVSKFYPVFHSTDKCNLYFLMTLMNNEPKTVRKIAMTAKGTGQKVLSFGDLQKIEINIPSLEEQQKIADFLSSVDDVIAASEEEVANLETQKKAVMKKIFSQEVRFKRADGSDFPEWDDDELGSLCEPHARIGWQNLRTDEFLDEGDYYLVTGTDFVDGRVNFSTCHYIDKDRYEMDRNIQIQNEDILITKDGTLGKVAIVKGMDKPGTLNAGVFVLQNITNMLDHEYLYQYLAAPFLLKFAREKSTGGTIQHLNQGVLVQFSVPIPCLEEQRLIADFLSDFDEAIAAAKKELELWKELKKGLLQQMFV